MATKKKTTVPKKQVAPTKKKTSPGVVKKKTAASSVKRPAFVPSATKWKAGDLAPFFEGVDQDGNTVSLSAFKGKKLVLYFYPKDDTPGCTAQACSLRDGYKLLKKKGIEVIGVSEDPIARHKKFETKYELPFRLIADVDRSVIRAYDVWGKKKFMGREYEGILRTTFLINEKGKIDVVIEKPDTVNHAEQILSLWK